MPESVLVRNKERKNGSSTWRLDTRGRRRKSSLVDLSPGYAEKKGRREDGFVLCRPGQPHSIASKSPGFFCVLSEEEKTQSTPVSRSIGVYWQTPGKKKKAVGVVLVVVTAVHASSRRTQKEKTRRTNENPRNSAVCIPSNHTRRRESKSDKARLRVPAGGPQRRSVKCLYGSLLLKKQASGTWPAANFFRIPRTSTRTRTQTQKAKERVSVVVSVFLSGELEALG